MNMYCFLPATSSRIEEFLFDDINCNKEANALFMFSTDKMVPSFPNKDTQIQTYGWKYQLSNAIL